MPRGKANKRVLRNDMPEVSSSGPSFLSTFDRETQYPIFSTLCDFLPIAEILSLARTCKKLSDLYRYLVPVQWDVNKALRHYFDDPIGFRSQMAKCDALIMGYFPTQFLERTLQGDQTMEIMVEQGVRSEVFKSYLKDIAVSDELASDDILSTGAIDVVEGRIFKSKAKNNPSFILYTTQCPPAQAILAQAESTDLSIVSWNKAYSIFALSTCIQRKSYLLHDTEWITSTRLRENPPEGWRAQGVMWPEEHRQNHPIRKRRRIGDCYTWTIPFDTTRVEPSKTPDYVLEYACFKMGLYGGYRSGESYHPENEDVRHYSIEVNKLNSKVLKHTYIYGEAGMREFLKPRLHSSTMLELRKMHPAQRPDNYDEILRNRGDIDSALEDFDRPASWTYRDDEFITWYEAYVKYLDEMSTFWG